MIITRNTIELIPILACLGHTMVARPRDGHHRIQRIKISKSNPEQIKTRLKHTKPNTHLRASCVDLFTGQGLRKNEKLEFDGNSNFEQHAKRPNGHPKVRFVYLYLFRILQILTKYKTNIGNAADPQGWRLLSMWMCAEERASQKVTASHIVRLVLATKLSILCSA